MNGLKTPVDGEQDGPKHGMMKLGWLVVSALLTVGTVGYVQYNEVGPRILWATNACPGSQVDGIMSTCGVMPLIVPIAAFGAVAVSLLGIGVIQRIGGNNA